MAVPYMLSMYDLRKYTTLWKKGWEDYHSLMEMKNNRKYPKNLLIMLYTAGMDITKKSDYGEIDIWCDIHLHRSLDGSVVKDWHFNGFERTDETWKRSGCASQEAILFTTDSSLVRELRQMSGEYDVNKEFKYSKNEIRKIKKQMKEE